MPTSRAASSLLLCLLVAATGCYRAIGISDIHPKAPPPLVDGQEIEATDRIVRHDSYHISSRGDIVQNKSRIGDATYGGEQLTLAQTAAMADPAAFEQVVGQANELRATCRRGVIPEVVATVATFAMSGFGIAVALSHGDSSSDLSTTENLGVMASYGSAGAAVLSYAIGYFMGGYACDKLAKFRRDNYLDDDSVKFHGDEVELVNKLAREFNTHRHAPANEPGEPPPPDSSGAQ